jgi:hypothetical protein
LGRLSLSRQNESNYSFPVTLENALNASSYLREIGMDDTSKSSNEERELNAEEQQLLNEAIEAYGKAVANCNDVAVRIELDRKLFADHLVELLRSRFTGKQLIHDAAIGLLDYTGAEWDYDAAREQLHKWVDECIQEISTIMKEDE